MWTARFWREALERAAKTAVQSLAAIAVSASTAATMSGGDWVLALKTAGFAAVFSVATSLVSSGVGDPNTPAALPAAPSGRHRKADE
ncbi:holin [Gordonia sihwensis]|uniref:Holin n=1 Tax=Gordonia sihwensis NBRC 108236 TaxID=1223544 RepID=L7LF33_9ACTN|nr:holin [Gordonia sihwensis]WFN93481.1 holin [Gordonia sihwensis]GAC59351.1 hypothetical protein GSI01S_01_03180 [Gordonia sihwensis NBRC 108236]